MAQGFESFGQSLDQMVSTAGEKTSAALIGELGPVILTGTTLYFTLKGWMYLTGRAQGAIPDTVISAFKVALISFFAMNAGNFTSFILGGISAIDSMLASSLAGANSSFGAIDSFWDKLLDQVEMLISFAGTAFGESLNPFSDRAVGEALWLLIIAAAMLAGAGLVTLIALAVFILCKVGLALVLGFGPLFLCTLMFPITRSWFDGWLKTCLGMTISTALIGSILALCTSMFDNMLLKLGAYFEQEPSRGGFASFLYDALVLLLAVAAIGLLIKQIPTMATAMVGGVGIGVPNLPNLPKKKPNQSSGSPFSFGSLSLGSSSKSAGSLPAPSTTAGALTDARANRALLSATATPLLSHSPNAGARVINMGPPSGDGSSPRAANNVSADHFRSMAFRSYGLGSNGDATFGDELRTKSGRYSRTAAA